MAPEWGWTHIWSPQPWQPRLLGAWWAVVGIAVVGSFLGSALGRAVAHARQLVPSAAVGLAFALLVLLLAIPFPRNGLDATATITSAPAGAATPTITREGLATFQQDMTVALTVSPATAADDSDVFRVFTWQGGRLIISPLRNSGGGHYTIDGAIPTGGSWKSIVFLEKGDVVAAVPVSFPADPPTASPPSPFRGRHRAPDSSSRPPHT